MISEELADYINISNWNCHVLNEDDDEEYTITITPVLPIEEPDNSLSMGDEHLSTILETVSKTNYRVYVEEPVNNTQVIPRIFVDIESEREMTFPRKIYSNPLFDEEIISTKIDPHHFNAESDLIESLFNQDTSIISSPKIDSLLEEFFGELAHIDLIPLGINEVDFDPEEEIRLVEKLFDSLMEEINLFLAPDDSMPPGIKNDDYDSEGDILFLEELLSNDSPLLPVNESFHFDVPNIPLVLLLQKPNR
ncbi:hypothetical protein Tco_0084101 [Tanacetum coccineum]